MKIYPVSIEVTYFLENVYTGGKPRNYHEIVLT